MRSTLPSSFGFCLAFFLTVFPMASTASEWSQVSAPSDGPARSIGQTNSGCIDGAQALPLDGKGYRVMHIERNRYYGHPLLLKAIEWLGRKTDDKSLGVLQVGDLGQPRGGPMSFGHRSHQTGLDVDVWFNLDPIIFANADRMRGNISAPSMLNGPKTGLDRSAWSSAQMAVLEMAASLPGVDRIFVNPHIKKELCDQADNNRGWLRKIRPWYHHDDHFHMRMACPPGSDHCEEQEPVPTGDGCDASLDWWLQIHPPTPTTTPPPPKPRLPVECRTVLESP